MGGESGGMWGVLWVGDMWGSIVVGFYVGEYCRQVECREGCG